MKLLFVFFVCINLYAQDEESLTNKALSNMELLWGVAKDITKEVIDESVKVGSEVMDDGVKYSQKGKNILIEQTVINSLNLYFDPENINIKKFTIADDNSINLEVFLNGEDEKLKVHLEEFQWSVSLDEKYILIEDIKIDLNIPWLQYLVDEKIKLDAGDLKLRNSKGLFAALFAIKPNKKSHKNGTSKLFDLFSHKFDKKKFYISKPKVYGSTLKIDFLFDGSSKPCKLELPNYKLLTANKKTVIVIKGFDDVTFCKPWIKSIIDSSSKEIHLKYDDKLFNILANSNTRI